MGGDAVELEEGEMELRLLDDEGGEVYIVIRELELEDDWDN